MYFSSCPKSKCSRVGVKEQERETFSGRARLLDSACAFGVRAGVHYNGLVGSRTGRSLLQNRGKSELRRAVCRITSGRAPALLPAGSFDGKGPKKKNARA